MSETYQIGLIQGVKDGMRQNYSLSLHKGNFPRKTKNHKGTQICLKYSLSTSLLSTLITFVKNISNWPVPGSKMGHEPKLFILTA